MTTYGGVYYLHMKDLKFRSALRVFKGLREPLGTKINWVYLTSEHFKYLYYREQMGIWRGNVKHVKSIKDKFRGKMV